MTSTNNGNSVVNPCMFFIEWDKAKEFIMAQMAVSFVRIV